MDDYQRLVVAQFFEPLPNLSQESCHEFVLDHVAPALLPSTAGQIDVQPSSFQGSMSYTAILHSHSGSRIAVQFRSDKQDLFGVTEASRIHGPIVPLVTYQDTYKGLFVYTSPFLEGTPYTSAVMSSLDFELPLHTTMATVLDLADLVTRGARENNTMSDMTILGLDSSLDRILHTVSTYDFRNETLRSSIFSCICKLLIQLPNVAAFPIVLSHQDLSPFNYLIDETTGHIQAVLDWDGATYLPIGLNFHFMDNLFGFITRGGWQDTKHRQELETAFYDRVLASLAAQGMNGVTKELLELQKAIGIFLYDVERLLKFKDEGSEHYICGHLQRLSFRDEFMVLN